MTKVDWRAWLGLWVIASALLVAVFESVPTVRTFSDRAVGNAALSAVDRDLAGAYSVDISRDFLLWADAVVAPNETYVVVIGSNVEVSTPVTLEAVRGYTRYVLQPRRLAAPEVADWLLCYGCDPSEWPSYRAVWEDGEGISLGRLRS